MKVYIDGMSRVVIVLKPGSAIDSAETLSHWVEGRTIKSLVEPHDRIILNRMTRLDNPVFRLNLYRYLIILIGLNR